ncbi:MAG: PLDc N-terminal domain-containing protein, partial [Bacilli bacterium]|nr:PLDc N-terminal domain-containing protein [Bacilli bacterium]
MAYFSEHWKYFSIVTRILAFLVATYIINTPILPEYKIAWLVPVLLAPVVGIPLYLMLGKHNFKKENSFYNRSQSEIKKYLGQHEEIIKRSLGEDYFVNRMGNYVYNSSKGRLNYGDKIKYYPSGETMWSAILEDLKCAKKYIFLEYFIFKPGQIYAALLETLTQKVKDGVEVYLLYDDLGCTYNIPTKYFKKLMKVGVKVRAFQPFRPF